MANIYQIGAGLVGKAMALDLAKEHNVFLADKDSILLQSIKNEFPSIKTQILDVNDEGELSKFIKPADIVLLAVPGFLGFKALEKIIKAKKNVVDISFAPEDALKLNNLAQQNNVTAIIDSGVAPGIPNYILGYHNRSMEINSFKYYVGGLPKNPIKPYNYKAPFSPIDVIEEYTRPARMTVDSKVITKPALSDIELIDFLDAGKLEAFNTDGLRSILSTMSHIPNMIEKTVRYPGHARLMQEYRTKGYFSPEKLDKTILKLFEEWKLGPKEEEFTVLDIIIKSDDENIHYHLYDEYDEKTNTSSMSRTTGYTATATINLILNNQFTKNGVFPPEIVGGQKSCWNFINHYLIKKGIHIKKL
jgi:saccharopine dehydrogenase-like NADP-dependent oxidoreductase